MADTPRYPDSREHTGGAGTPRWVKVFGVIALVVALLFVILLLTGRGGGHGPGRHRSSGAGGQTAPSSVTEHGAQQP